MGINYNIPIAQNLPQTFTKFVNGRTVKVAIIYNKLLDNWLLYFAELVNDQEIPLVSGVPLVTGVNILQQFPHKKLGDSFIVYQADPSVEFDAPQATTLNSQFIYIWNHD